MEKEGSPNFENHSESGQIPEEEILPTFYFIRHSKSDYRTYTEGLKTNPTGKYDSQNQLSPDLTEEGFQLAEQEAKKLLAKLDPEKDIIYFISSPEQRALDTANIYLNIAESMGFTIIESATEKDVDRVRAINTLGIKVPSFISIHVFNPKTLLRINEEDLDDEAKARWQRAREIIDADDRGTWGANYDAHALAIKELFPEVETAEELYKKQFSKIIRLLHFANKKIEESSESKNIKVLGFGHENYVSYFLNKYFQEKDIKNCEAINFEVDDNHIEATYRDKTVTLEEGS